MKKNDIPFFFLKITPNMRETGVESEHGGAEGGTVPPGDFKCQCGVQGQDTAVI